MYEMQSYNSNLSTYPTNLNRKKINFSNIMLKNCDIMLVQAKKYLTSSNIMVDKFISRFH